jgi:hypothetical protein
MSAGAVLVAMALLAVVQVPPAGGSTFQTVSGVVTDSNGATVAGAHVGIFASEFDFEVTGPDGGYSVGVPQSATPYDVHLLYPCAKDQRKSVLVDADKTVDFTVPAAPTRDTFGYRCRPAGGPFTDITTDGELLMFPSDDDSMTTVTLPFAFRYYGVDYSTLNIGTNGLASFTSNVSSGVNSPIDTDEPNGLYPFWDDLVIDDQSGVYTLTRGTGSTQEFVIEWSNLHFYNDDDRITFEMILRKNKTIAFLYGDEDRADPRRTRARGTSATIGIENASGNDGIQQSFGTPSIDDNMSIEFTAPK